MSSSSGTRGPSPVCLVTVVAEAREPGGDMLVLQLTHCHSVGESKSRADLKSRGGNTLHSSVGGTTRSHVVARCGYSERQRILGPHVTPIRWGSCLLDISFSVSFMGFPLLSLFCLHIQESKQLGVVCYAALL